MDINWLLFLQSIRTDGISNFFMNISNIVFSTYIYIIIAVIYWCFNKKNGLFVLSNLFLGLFANNFIKNLFCVYRPWIRDTRIIPYGDSKLTAGGYSFPSGHTTIATAIFGSVAYIMRDKKWVTAVCSVLIFLVMLSRNWLGVHTPQDVIVGLATTLIVIFINVKIFEWIDKKPNNDIILAAVMSVITLAIIFIIRFKPYPVDYDVNGNILVDSADMIPGIFMFGGFVMGFFIGIALERHFVKFSTDVGALEKVLRTIGGAAAAAVFLLVIKEPIVSMNVNWGSFSFFFLITLFLIALYPALFNAVAKIFKKNG